MSHITPRRPVAWLAASCLAALCVTSCGTDAADQEYFAALRGEERGMTREEQLAHIDRAIELAPQRASYRETHAIYAIDLHRFEMAAADLDTAIQLADRPYLRFLRGLVSCQRGRYKESLADFDHAIREQPDNTQFYRGRSLARSKTGRYRDALEDAERLVSLVPQQAESHFAMGTAQAGMGRWDNAIEAYGEALRRRPELLYPLRARAEAFEHVGNRDRASADLAELARRERNESLCAPCRDPFRY